MKRIFFHFLQKDILLLFFENLENFCGSYSITFKKDLYPSGYSNSGYFRLCKKKLMGFKCYINLKQTKESDNSVQTTDVLILRLFYGPIMKI